MTTKLADPCKAPLLFTVIDTAFQQGGREARDPPSA